MFGKSKNDRDSIASLIGAGTTVTGDLSFCGGLHLDGRILGDVSGTAAEPSKLTVSPKGVIEGSVSVEELVLLGIVRGDVEARARVELGPTAQVDGDVNYQVLQMAAGARVNGRLIHKAGPGSGQQTLPAPGGGDPRESQSSPEEDEVPGLR
jgi:cytoskeletal protein CcmA (bactofilin family)